MTWEDDYYLILNHTENMGGGGGGGSGGNHGMDWHPIKGGIVTLLVASCEESRMTSSEPGQATAQI